MLRDVVGKYSGRTGDFRTSNTEDNSIENPEERFIEEYRPYLVSKGDIVLSCE